MINIILIYITQTLLDKYFSYILYIRVTHMMCIPVLHKEIKNVISINKSR